MGVDGELESLVGHLAFVTGDAGGCCRTRRQTYVHQHVCGFLVIVVHAEGQSVVQYSQVKTDVRLVGSFPFQVTCSQVGLADTGNCMVVTFFKPGYAVDVVTLQIRVIAYTALVTGLSPATAELQVINPSDVFHELFRRNAPCSREGGENTPAMVGMQLG